MLIEVVSHCWAGDLPLYAAALTYQLSSLVLDKPKDCKVMATICWDRLRDEATGRVLDWYVQVIGESLQTIDLPIKQLGRRAIGRNIAAKATKADVVWFTDVDYTFREGVLDRLAAMEWPKDASMIYPRRIRIHRDHAIGDAALRLVEGEPRLIDVDPAQFIGKQYSKAIGGVQIVRGDYARRQGYLDGDPKWQRPVEGGFRRCACDVPFRKRCWANGLVTAVDLPGLYRLRHTEAGHGRLPKL